MALKSKKTYLWNQYEILILWCRLTSPRGGHLRKAWEISANFTRRTCLRDTTNAPPSDWRPPFPISVKVHIGLTKNRKTTGRRRKASITMNTVQRAPICLRSINSTVTGTRLQWARVGPRGGYTWPSPCSLMLSHLLLNGALVMVKDAKRPMSMLAIEKRGTSLFQIIWGMCWVYDDSWT